MKIYELKLQPKFYDLIISGIKKVEVRKRSKSYIQANDIIMYKDLENDEILGFAKVLSVHTIIKDALLDYWRYWYLDKDTMNFIKSHYQDEKLLYLMKIEYITIYEIACKIVKKIERSEKNESK